MKLTEKEKQKAVEEATQKISDILKVNGLSLLDLDAKMRMSVIMIYQQGLKDAKDLLNQP